MQEQCEAIIPKTQTRCRYKAKHTAAATGQHVCGKHIGSVRGECSICLLPIKSRTSHTVLEKCSHGFHTRCIRTWLRRGVLTCPVCRAPCLAELSTLRGSMVSKVRLVVNTLPPPPGSFFPTYIIGLLSSPPVQRGLALDDDGIQMMIDIAYQTFTEELFFRVLRANS